MWITCVRLSRCLADVESRCIAAEPSATSPPLAPCTMASASSRHAQAVQATVARQLDRLVGHLITLRPEEAPAMFKKAVAFAESNVRFHRFLAPNGHEVTRTFTGIIEKLTIHTLPDKVSNCSGLWPRPNRTMCPLGTVCDVCVPLHRLWQVC